MEPLKANWLSRLSHTLCWAIAITTISLPAMAIDSKAPRLSSDLVVHLPGPDLKTLHATYTASGLSQGQAELAMSGALAAIYCQQGGILTMLCDDHLAGVEKAAKRFSHSERLSHSLLSAFSLSDSMTLMQFLQKAQDLRSSVSVDQIPYFIVKFPCRATGAPPAISRGNHPRTPPGKAAESGTVLYEGFENGLSNWNLWDNTYGEYTWTTTTCDAHSGAYSADAVRGGSMGSSLGCTDLYPQGVTTNMQDLGCENLAGAQQAWLDAYISVDTDPSPGYASPDYLGFYFAQGGLGWGWVYWGYSPSWWHVVQNLRQWYEIGDLTQYSCNQLWIMFVSQYNTPPGFGARIDDITIQTYSAPGLGCSISATPTTGYAPLTVNFAANTVGASGYQTYLWNFGDGTTDTTQNPAHSYTTSGDYWASLTVTDGVTTCSSTVEIIVQQGSCNLSLSPASLPSGMAGREYSQSISASGGTAPYSYTVSSGALPPGITLSYGGSIFGTPTQAGTFTFTITATDANGCIGNQGYTLLVSSPGYSISGRVTCGGEGLPGVTISATVTHTNPPQPPTLIAQTVTDANGGFSVSVPAGGSYQLAPCFSGYYFSPACQVVTLDQSGATGISFTAYQLSYLPVPFLSQRDPRWACYQLGTCSTSPCSKARTCSQACANTYYDTIYQEGCYITSIAMVMDFINPGCPESTNPYQIDNTLWNDDSSQSCLVSWPLRIDNVTFNYQAGTAKGVPLKDLATLSGAIDQQLSSGLPVLAAVRYKKSGTYLRKDNTHMVVIIGKAMGNTNLSSYYILDPWDLQQPSSPRTLNNGAINGKPYDLRAICSVSR